MLNKNDLYLTLQDIINMENDQLTKTELLEIGNSKIEEYDYKVSQSELIDIVEQLINEHY